MAILIEEHFDADLGPFVVDVEGWEWGLDYGYVNGGVKSYRAWGFISAGSLDWTDYSFRAMVMGTGVESYRAMVLLARYSDVNNWYALVLELDRNIIEIWKNVAGVKGPSLASKGFVLDDGVWYDAKIEVRTTGSAAEIIGYINGTEVIRAVDDPAELTSGKIAFHNYNLPEMHFDDVLVEEVVPPTPEEATLSGVVTDAETTLPIEGATVELNGYTTVTATDGSYSLVVLVGTFTFTVTKNGYEPFSQLIDLTVAGAYTLDVQLTPIPLPPPGMGSLSVHAYADTTEVVATVEVVGVGTYTTPFTVDVLPGSYTLNATYDTQTQTKTIDALEGQIIPVTFQFVAPPPPCPAHAAYMPQVFHPDLTALRKFRDVFVPRRLKRIYYKYSPLLTPLIINSENRKLLVRRFLKPIIEMVKCLCRQ